MKRSLSILTPLSAALSLVAVACSAGSNDSSTGGDISGSGGLGTGGTVDGSGGPGSGGAGTGGAGSGETGTGGVATQGTGGSGSLTDPPVPCGATSGTIPNRVCIKGKNYYLNGINVAWDQWTADLSNYDSTEFRSMFAEIAAAGGNSVRWWWFIDGSKQLTYDGQLPQPLSQTIFDNLDQAFDDAAEYGILLMPSLLSFDIKNQGNEFLVTNQASTEAFIDNVVKPLVVRYNDHAAMGLWEIMNEGDWLLTSESGGTVSAADYQRFHALVAAGIHAADADALVTTGSASFKYLTGPNLMADSALIAAAGGDTLATLDVYQTHYYSWMHGDGWSYEPWIKTAGAWLPDGKPVLIGEFACKGEEGRWSALEMHTESVKQGYAGTFCWAYFDNRQDKEGYWPDAKPGVSSIAGSIPGAITGE